MSSEKDTGFYERYRWHVERNMGIRQILDSDTMELVIHGLSKEIAFKITNLHNKEIAQAKQEAVKGFIKFVMADAMLSLGVSPLVVYIDEDVAGVRKGFSYAGDFLDLIRKYLPEKELNQIEKELQEEKLKAKSKVR